MRRFTRLLPIAALIALLDVGVAGAENEDLSRAIELKDALKYREAYDAVSLAIERGDATPAELATMHRLAAEVSAGVGESDRAAKHFEHYLALDPSGSLDAGASPKLTDPFITARSGLEGRAIGATHRIVGASLEVDVEDPSKLAHAMRVAVFGAGIRPGETIRVEGEPPYRVALPTTRPLRLTITVLDEHDNRIVDLASDSAPIVLARLEQPERRAVSKPTSWAIAAGLSGAVTLTFGLLALSAQSELDDLNQQARDDPFTVSFDDIHDVEVKGRRYALVANVGFGVTGAAVFAAIALWWVHRRDGESGGPKPTVSVGDGGLTVGATARF